MLLDIFADAAFNRFSELNEDGTVVHSMEEILKVILDKKLVPKAEFGEWYDGLVDEISDAQDKIREIQ